MNAEQEIKKLREELETHNRNYYILDEPTISDFEYDAMLRRLEDLEAAHPEFASPNSPTQRVGGRALDTFAPMRHEVPLESLADVFSEDELTAFLERTTPALALAEYTVEPKVDGLSMALIYENGEFVRGGTRGDGLTGEDVTANLKTIRSIPLRLKNAPERIIVRGEVYMPDSVFEELNARREELDEKPFANPRNAAAGTMRQLDPRVVAERKLDIRLFNVQTVSGEGYKTHSESLEALADMGFPVIPFKLCRSAEECLAEVRRIGEERDKYPFGIDGAVVKANLLSDRAALGSTSKFPRWAVAYKFEAEEVTTKLKKVTWEVGRTGKLTPLAHVEPVELAGATIQRATLNNYGDILRKRLKLNARVWLRRSNEVIPEITGRVDEYYPDETEIEMPEECPCCGHALEEKGAFIYCPNSRNCTDQIVMRLSHFASRDAMDIEAFSEKTARQFCDEFDIKDCDELYDLQYDKLVALDRFGEKKAQKLLEELDKSKSVRLDRFIYALGIPNVDTKTARDLAEAFGDIEKLKSATAEELTAIGDIGDIVADSILDYFASDTGRGLADRLLAKGVQPVWENEKLGSSLNGMTVVVTGTLVNYSRQQAEELIRQNGGKASSSVSAKTSLVLAGENAGSKLDKAQKLGIRIVNEEEFEKIIAKS